MRASDGGSAQGEVLQVHVSCHGCVINVLARLESHRVFPEPETLQGFMCNPANKREGQGKFASKWCVKWLMSSLC